MKKIVIGIIIGIIILCTIGLFINKNQSNKKIYLTKKYYDNKKQVFLQVDEQEIKKLKEETFLLYTYNSYCKFPVPCDSIFEQFMKDNNITILSIPYEKNKLTDYVKKVKYAPSVLIINKNKAVTISIKPTKRTFSSNTFNKSNLVTIIPITPAGIVASTTNQQYL